MQNEPTPTPPQEEIAHPTEITPSAPIVTSRSINKTKFIIISLAGIIIVAASVASILYFTQHRLVASTTTSASTPAGKVAKVTPSSAADNQSLQNNLTDITSADTTDSSNLSSTDSSLDDQQQAITVPTN